MKFAELIAGDTRSNLEHDALARESRRTCQEIRTYQNLVSFALVSLVGVAYVFSLWSRTDTTALLIWYTSFSALTIVRACVYESVRKSLQTASAAKLLRNEVSLAVTGAIVCVALGMSYWIVGIPGDERTVLAITVLSCVYAAGATINSATQTRHLLIYLVAILGQAILFWIGLGNRTDYALSLLLTCLFVLLYTFALRNRGFIVESVRMRLENKAHNQRLINNRALVEEALESALEANRSKSHIIAAVSHDLAQPVHALSYLVGSLKSSVNDESAQTDIVEKIELSIGLLERQFDGFVDLARYDASDLTVKYKQFDLLTVCRVVVYNKQAEAAKNNVELRLHGASVVVVSDAVLLGRVIGNLLDNAIKFGAGARVHVHLRQLGDWGVVEVKDGGIGIDPEDLPKIFGDFVRIHSQDRIGAPGAGLGLAIVGRIAQALEVEVFVESVQHRGTTFTLLVPMTHLPDEAEQRTLPPVTGQSIRKFTDSASSLAVPRIELHGKVILLVREDSSVPDALEATINELGGRVITATTTEQSLLLLKDNRVDLAFVDDRIKDQIKDKRAELEVSLELGRVLGRDKVVLLTTNASRQRTQQMEKAGFSVYPAPLKCSKLQAILSTRLGTGLS